MRPTLYYTDHHEVVLPPGHKFPMRKYRLVRELLNGGQFEFARAPEATVDAVAIAHDRAYVEGFVAGRVAESVMRRIGFPWSETLVRRTLASVGGTMQAARDAIASGSFGGTLAGGTHHAFPSEGSGFCVFNDIAVAIRCLQSEGSIRRFAVVDLDVHQGDGTALFFQNDTAVLTFSMHGRNNFPFRKQRSKVDVELEDKTGDEEYLRTLEAMLPRVGDFSPEIVFYQSGVDALTCDRLGRLALTHDGLKRRDTIVVDLAQRLRVPLVVTLGGGYGDPIEETARAHANTYKTVAALMGH